MNIVNLFNRRGKTRDRFENLIRPHIDRLYRLAFRLCNNPDEAEELVQELLTRLFGKIDHLENLDNLSPWLNRSLYNLYIDHYRSAVRDTSLFDHEIDGDQCVSAQISPLQSASNKDLRKKINAAILELNDDQRVVVLLHDAEGYTLSELSEMLQVPLGTLKSRLHRARNSLIKSLSVEPFDEMDREQVREGRIQ